MKNTSKANCNYTPHPLAGFTGRPPKLALVALFCAAVTVVWVGFGTPAPGPAPTATPVFAPSPTSALAGAGAKATLPIATPDFFVNGLEIVARRLFDCGHPSGGVAGAVLTNGPLSPFIGADRPEGAERIWLAAGADAVVERDGRLGVDLELVDMVDVGGVCRRGTNWMAISFCHLASTGILTGKPNDSEGG